MQWPLWVQLKLHFILLFNFYGLLASKILLISDINGNIVSMSAHYHVKQSRVVAHSLLDIQLELDHSGETLINLALLAIWLWLTEHTKT